MMGWGDGGWGAGDWVAMSAMMVLFWGAVIALGLWVARSVRSDRGQAPSAGADLLLAERFARGEIDAEEFTRSRVLLHASGSSLSRSRR